MEAKAKRRWYQFSLRPLLIEIAVLSAGCGQRSTLEHARKVAFCNTPEYEAKVKTLRFTPAQARELVIKFASAKLSDTTISVFIGDHYAIVGDDYLFSTSNKRGVSLCGYYVNGISGEVSHNMAEDAVLSPP